MEQYKHLTCVNNKKDLKDRGKNIEENLDTKLVCKMYALLCVVCRNFGSENLSELNTIATTYVTHHIYVRS